MTNLPLFLLFLPSLGNCHQGGAAAGGAGLPTPSPLGVLLKGNVGLFFFALLFIWRITSIVLPAVTDTEVVLARRLQGGFAIEAPPAHFWGWMDGSLTFLHSHCHHTPGSGAAILINRYYKLWLV